MANQDYTNPDNQRTWRKARGTGTNGDPFVGEMDVNILAGGPFGSTTDADALGDGSLIAITKRNRTLLDGTRNDIASILARTATLGQKTAAGSAPVVLATEHAAAATPLAVRLSDGSAFYTASGGGGGGGGTVGAPSVVRSVGLAPGVITLTVTNGAYSARTVFGGPITLPNIFPDVGTGADGGRAFTITEVAVSMASALSLGLVACTRTPGVTTADAGAFVFEPSRQMAARPLSSPVQVSNTIWTCFLENPITVVQSTLDTTSSLFLYLVVLAAGSHAGTSASIRAAGFRD